jgi:hypothetical protein
MNVLMLALLLWVIALLLERIVIDVVRCGGVFSHGAPNTDVPDRANGALRALIQVIFRVLSRFGLLCSTDAPLWSSCYRLLLPSSVFTDTASKQTSDSGMTLVESRPWSPLGVPSSVGRRLAAGMIDLGRFDTVR